MKRFPLLLSCVLLVLSSCSRVQPARNVADLRRNLELAPGVELWGERVVGDWIQLVAGETLDREWRWQPLRIGDAEHPGHPGRARIQFARGVSDRMQDLLGRVGATLTDQGFEFEGRKYHEPGDALVFTIQDPLRPGLPLTVYYFVDEREGTLERRYVCDLRINANPGVRAYRQGQVDLVAETNLGGQIQRTTLEDRGKLEARLFKNHTREQSTHSSVVLRARANFDAERFASYAARVDTAAQRANTWLGGAPDAASVDVRILERVEDFAALYGQPRMQHVNRVTGEVTALLEEGVPDDGGAGAALALALKQLGPSHAPWLEHGLAVDAADAWWGHGLRSWASLLQQPLGESFEYARLGELCSVSDLMDSRATERWSRHRIRPLQGLLCRFLRSELGVAGLASVWSGELEFEPTDEDFQRWLETAAEGQELHFHGGGFAPHARPFMSGANLLESRGARFGSDRSQRSLDELAATSANAISITAFLPREPARPAHALVGHGADTEALGGDLALAATLARARAGFYRVVLSPHYLTSPSGSHEGAQVRSTRAEWERYFDDRSSRFVEHFALLAGLASVDVLSLGSGLGDTTRTAGPGSEWEPEQLKAWKLEGWKKTIELASTLLGVGGPKLTYSATWPLEAREIEFWSELDFISCNLYSHFRKSPDDSWTPPGQNQVREATKQRVNDMLEFARETGKKVLVAEFGLASSSLAWRDPRGAAGEVDPVLQARVLRAMGQGIADAKAGSSGQLAGVFLWNWFTDPYAGGSSEGGFTPQNKPAAAALKKIFSQL